MNAMNRRYETPKKPTLKEWMDAAPIDKPNKLKDTNMFEKLLLVCYTVLAIAFTYAGASQLDEAPLIHLLLVFVGGALTMLTGFLVWGSE